MSHRAVIHLWQFVNNTIAQLDRPKSVTIDRADVEFLKQVRATVSTYLEAKDGPKQAAPPSTTDGVSAG